MVLEPVLDCKLRSLTIATNVSSHLFKKPMSKEFLGVLDFDSRTHVY
jgi:hypothetical protein